MHDIGLLGFLKCYPKRTGIVLGNVLADLDRALVAEQTLNVDHGRAGAWLAKSWALPYTVVECCEHHHEPFHSKDSELLCVVKAGCRIADALGFTAFRLTTVPGYDEVLRSLSPVARDRFPSRGRVAGERRNQARSLSLSIRSGVRNADFPQPARPQAYGAAHSRPRTFAGQLRRPAPAGVPCLQYYSACGVSASK